MTSLPSLTRTLRRWFQTRPAPPRLRLGLSLLEDRVVPTAVADFSVVNAWTNGMQGAIALTNTQSTAINGWRLEFEFNGSVSQIWGARLVSRQGSHYVVENLGWNARIEAGQSVQFGFIATPADAPTHFVLNGTPLNGTAPPINVTLSVADASVIEGTATSSPDTPASGYFQTQGNQIVDAQGRSVRLAGVNWFGMETTTSAPHGLWTRNWRDMMDQIKALGFNTIRLPFSNQLFDPGSTPNGIDWAKNPDLQGLTGLQIMDKIVNYAGQIGLRIILDHHRSEAGSGAGSGLWYTSAYPESRWISDWVMLARRYAGNPTVIGADLHNEPHGAATWGSGQLATDWRLAAERAGNAILAVNPNWLIIVEGVESGPSGNYWWGGNLSAAGAFPVRLDVPNRLVYSPHDYPASVFPQSYFSDPNYPANLFNVWDRNWGYLFRQNIAPVLIGEFGSKLETVSDRLWFAELTKYLAGDLNGDGQNDLPAGHQGVSWTYWSWNPNSGDTGGILRDDWTSVHANKVDPLKPVMFAFPATGSGSSPGSSSSIVFTITLSQASTQPVTVAYATVPGTAGSSDFTPVQGTLTFAPGETTHTVRVPIIGDSLPEPQETFRLVLSHPSGAILARGEAIGTIIDDDTPTPPPPRPPVVPSLSVADVTVNEGAGSATFIVRLSEAAATPVTVPFTTLGGTAQAGVDLTVVTGTLVFAPGATQQTVAVPIIDDTLVEGPETFRLVLGNPEGATLAVGEATATIIDNDIAPPPSSGTGRATFQVANNWGSGFIGQVTLTNTTNAPLNGWTVTFDADFEITNLWGGEVVSRIGSRYVIRSMPWNSRIPVAGRIEFGFQASPGGAAARVSHLTLHGSE